VDPRLDELVEHIGKLQAAIELPDDHECGCERKRMTTPHYNRAIEAEIELPRCQEAGKLYSKRHGKVVTVWRCTSCGTLNAHDLGPPAAQLHLYEHRKREEGRIAAALRRGMRVTAADVDHHESLSDHVLLKPKNG
jgi:ribosomal protein L37AE/L43A